MKSGQRIHGVDRAAGGGGEVTSHRIGIREDRVELHAVLGRNRLLGGMACRHVDKGVSRNGDEIHIVSVGPDLHHHCGVGVV